MRGVEYIWGRRAENTEDRDSLGGDAMHYSMLLEQKKEECCSVQFEFG